MPVRQSNAAVATSLKNRGLDEAIHAIPVAWFRPVPGGVLARLSRVGGRSAGRRSFWLSSRPDGTGLRACSSPSSHCIGRCCSSMKSRTEPGGTCPASPWRGTRWWAYRYWSPRSCTRASIQTITVKAATRTEADPEYLPFGRRSPALIVGAVFASLLAPVALAVRFGILAPLSWASPAVRRLVATRYSALVINHRYQRRAPIAVAGRVQEAAACLWLWASAALWWSGWLPTTAVWCWASASAAVSAINAVRTLGCAPLRSGLGRSLDDRAVARFVHDCHGCRADRQARRHLPRTCCAGRVALSRTAPLDSRDSVPQPGARAPRDRGHVAIRCPVPRNGRAGLRAAVTRPRAPVSQALALIAQRNKVPSLRAALTASPGNSG